MAHTQSGEHPGTFTRQRAMAGCMLAGILLMVSTMVCAQAESAPIVQAQLGLTPSKSVTASRLASSPAETTLLAADTFSIAPLVLTASSGSYMTPADGPTTHTFDGMEELLGNNLKGSAGGKFIVLEGIIPQGNGVERYVVEVTAVNANNIAEPWVNSSQSVNNYLSWRLDLGSHYGGSNRLEPATPFVKVDSGFNVFSSGGQLLASFDLSLDSSAGGGLSGVVQLGNSGNNIAGVNVSTIQMYWDILPEPTDLDLRLVDTVESDVLPGAELNVFVHIENLGPVASGSSALELFASQDSVITGSDLSLGLFGFLSLAANEQFDTYLSVALPVGIANGNYYIGGILSVADTNPVNNTNHDPIPIRVGTDANIRVRPLSLDFGAPSTILGNAEAALVSALSVPAPRRVKSRANLPLLEKKARHNGRARVIVELDIPVQPEGNLSEPQLDFQRTLIGDQAARIRAGLNGLGYFEHARYKSIPFMALSVTPEALENLANSPLVLAIEEDKLAFPTLQSSNPVIGSPLAWAEGFEGTGQTVAVLDTGVDGSHPWFSSSGNKIVSEACFSHNVDSFISLCPGQATSSIAAGSGAPCDLSIDGCEHGTHVAGIAAGNDHIGPRYGVARGADIISMQVFTRSVDPEDCGNFATPCLASFSSDQVSALERVLVLKDSFNIAAVNMSLGAERYFDPASCDADNSAVKAAIDQLRSFNIATVIASGNDGWKDSITAPACISTAVSVGNTTDFDSVAASSNISPQISLLAPGTIITSAVPGTGVESFSGTSMSAPQVAGAWAALRQAQPDESVAEILARLVNSATQLDDLRPGGTVTNLPRINLDLALGPARTTFGIFNDGPASLSVSAISTEAPAPWISWIPQAPFEVQPGEVQVVKIMIDYSKAPAGLSQSRLLIQSNDQAHAVYPDGVFIQVENSNPIIFRNGFE